MTTDFVGAEHDFHNKEFALGWSDRFKPSPERIRLFNLILAELEKSVSENGHIIELGMGPGYLAEYLLERTAGVSYTGIDFSLPMLEIAQHRLLRFSPQVTYTQADLVNDAWEETVSKPVHAIVSTWALHDLGNPKNIKTVYERSYRALNRVGVLINGDFIKPAEARQPFEGGRFPVSRHLELLDYVGFSDASCLSMFETEIEHPTSVQNYACLLARNEENRL